MSLNAESSAVQAHLTILQGVIQRMAENSRSCKVWCVTLVSAILVLVARTGEPHHALLALAPALLFLLLDAYYLALERAFRNSYDAFGRQTAFRRFGDGRFVRREAYGHGRPAIRGVPQIVLRLAVLRRPDCYDCPRVAGRATIGFHTGEVTHG